MLVMEVSGVEAPSVFKLFSLFSTITDRDLISRPEIGAQIVHVSRDMAKMDVI